jgi:hypothetical protein
VTINYLRPKYRIGPTMGQVRKPPKVNDGLLVQNIPQYPQMGGRSSEKNDAEAQARDPGMALERGGPQSRKDGPI